LTKNKADLAELKDELKSAVKREAAKVGSWGFVEIKVVEMGVDVWSVACCVCRGGGCGVKHASQLWPLNGPMGLEWIQGGEDVKSAVKREAAKVGGWGLLGAVQFAIGSKATTGRPWSCDRS
jgi:hypothetical protein